MVINDEDFEGMGNDLVGFEIAGFVGLTPVLYLALGTLTIYSIFLP
jgi:hypothetical protein